MALPRAGEIIRIGATIKRWENPDEIVAQQKSRDTVLWSENDQLLRVRVRHFPGFRFIEFGYKNSDARGRAEWQAEVIE